MEPKGNFVKAFVDKIEIINGELSIYYRVGPTKKGNWYGVVNSQKIPELKGFSARNFQPVLLELTEEYYQDYQELLLSE